MIIVSVDWRKPGDFSAVGQLTKRIFSLLDDAEIYSIQCRDDRKSCLVFKRNGDGDYVLLYESPVLHDAVLSLLRSGVPSVFYVRLSPHLGVLELSCKLAGAFKNVPMIVHYMDVPFTYSLKPVIRNYIHAIYTFLIRRSARTYVIDKAVLDWFSSNHSRDAYVLSNFASQQIARSDSKQNNAGILSISYFGSLDKVMNAAAILDICRTLSQREGIALTIWSNSGIWGESKAVAESSANISVNTSKLSESEYINRMSEADLLLLPYNSDAAAIQALKHSFSNKLIDYLESGSPILVYGPKGIPTVDACSEYNVALIEHDLAAVTDLFSDTKSLAAKVRQMSATMVPGRNRLIEEKKRLALEFVGYLHTLIESPGGDVLSGEGGVLQSINSRSDPAIKNRVSFLIKRRFFDRVTNQQSLSSTLMANSLKSLGYDGFDYEI